MRKLITIILILSITSIALILGCAKEQMDIKIGALLPLTGSAAIYGEWAKNGAQLAAEKINHEGGINGKRLEILFEDSKSDPKEGISAFRQLIAIHGIQAVIIEFSGLVLAAGPIADENKIVLLNCGAVNPQIREAGDFVFSNINDAKVEAYQMAAYAFNTLGIRRLGLLHSTESHGVGSKTAMKERFKKLGGEIVAEEGFEENSPDFRTQITKLKQSAPEAVYLAGVVRDCGRILKQAKELSFKTQWLGLNYFEGEDILTIAKGAAEGVIYTSTVLDASSDDPNIQTFISSYQKKYGVVPEIYSATAYDAINILAMAISKVGNDAVRIRDFLYTVKDYQGVSGLTIFDEDGVVEKPVMFKTVSNGKFIRLEN